MSKLNDIQRIYIGSREVKRIAVGPLMIWPAASIALVGDVTVHYSSGNSLLPDRSNYAWLTGTLMYVSGGLTTSSMEVTLTPSAASMPDCYSIEGERIYFSRTSQTSEVAAQTCNFTGAYSGIAATIGTVTVPVALSANTVVTSTDGDVNLSLLADSLTLPADGGTIRVTISFIKQVTRTWTSGVTATVEAHPGKIKLYLDEPGYHVYLGEYSHGDVFETVAGNNYLTTATYTYQIQGIFESGDEAYEDTISVVQAGDQVVSQTSSDSDYRCEATLEDHITAGGGYAIVHPNCSHAVVTTYTWRSGGTTTSSERVDEDEYVIMIQSGTSERFSVSPSSDVRIEHSSMLKEETTDELHLTVRNSSGLSVVKNLSAEVTNTKTTDTVYQVSLSPDAETIGAAGGNVVIAVSCHATTTHIWTSGERETSSPGVIARLGTSAGTLSSTIVSGDGLVTLSVPRNTGVERNINVVLQGSGFADVTAVIRQEGQSAYLTATIDRTEFHRSGGTAIITVEANQPWSVSTALIVSSWATIDPVSGSGDGVVRITIPSGYTSNMSRSVLITIEGDNGDTQQFRISQDNRLVITGT